MRMTATPVEKNRGLAFGSCMWSTAGQRQKKGHLVSAVQYATTAECRFHYSEQSRTVQVLALYR